MSAPMTDEQSNAMIRILYEVRKERLAQHAKWGEQNHPDGTDWDEWVIHRDLAQAQVESATADGTLTFQAILQEEALEAFAETDTTRLRAELVQLAAVAVQWIEAIDRRKS